MKNTTTQMIIFFAALIACSNVQAKESVGETGARSVHVACKFNAGTNYNCEGNVEPVLLGQPEVGGEMICFRGPRPSQEVIEKAPSCEQAENKLCYFFAGTNFDCDGQVTPALLGQAPVGGKMICYRGDFPSPDEMKDADACDLEGDDDDDDDDDDDEDDDIQDDEVAACKFNAGTNYNCEGNVEPVLLGQPEVGGEMICFRGPRPSQEVIEKAPSCEQAENKLCYFYAGTNFDCDGQVTPALLGQAPVGGKMICYRGDFPSPDEMKDADACDLEGGDDDDDDDDDDDVIEHDDIEDDKIAACVINSGTRYGTCPKGWVSTPLNNLRGGQVLCTNPSNKSRPSPPYSPCTEL